MSHFEWTSPTRRIGSRILSPIPNEVYLEIFSYFEPSEVADHADCKRVLSSLALVCRFFGAVSISRIYRSLEFSGRDVTPGYAPFCRLLVNDTPDARFAGEVAQLVRECTFKDWISEAGWASNFLDLYLRAVRRMPNVDSFHLESMPITESLICAITKHPETVSTLTIRSCTIETEISAKARKRLNTLTLRTLEYFPAPSATASAEIPPSTLRLRALEAFRTDSWPFGYYFIMRQHPTLRVLELHDVQDLVALFAFLAKSPTLTDLVLPKIMILKAGEPLPALAPTALPNIRSLTIPPSLLALFSRRTLSSVSLAGIEERHWDEDVWHVPALPFLAIKELSPLIQSGASLTALHVPAHVYFAFPLHKHLVNP
ncbi:hypothetical protein DFH07DRAFT_840791 [Mycena maculata]|uniref:F-box domain-containing protein n=1 Tax=Mycena maculata TaxID=230809 RepID=A0AAD7ICF2_9AGAR|nr:hypothetical protein DFH07DRAFT_840791 [Mycena maculata]